jgi:hypothetical protein
MRSTFLILALLAALASPAQAQQVPDMKLLVKEFQTAPPSATFPAKRCRGSEDLEICTRSKHFAIGETRYEITVSNSPAFRGRYDVEVRILEGGKLTTIYDWGAHGHVALSFADPGAHMLAAYESPTATYWRALELNAK